jgi:hypothetical protein
MSDTTQDPFELPDVAPADLRRAVRRGVIRTALLAALWLFIAWIALQFASGLYFELSGRRDRLENVVLEAFRVSHPDVDAEVTGCCNASPTSQELILQVRPVSASPLQPVYSLHPRDTLFGGVDANVGVPATTPIEHALSGGAPTRAASERAVARLPEGSRASAVVTLARPLAPGEARGVQDDQRAWFLTPPFDSNPGHCSGAPITAPGPGPSVAAFQKWAQSLSSGDDDILCQFGLPGAKRLQQVARDGRVYGFVVDDASRDQLGRLLADPRVGTVALGDAAIGTT